MTCNKRTFCKGNFCRFSSSCLILLYVFFVFAGFLGGFWLHKYQLLNFIAINKHLSSVRLSGYKFVSPLLVCDNSSNATVLDKYKSLTSNIKDTINDSQSKNDISSASVYFRNLKDGSDFAINDSEEYAPASLNKIPLMIVYYKMAAKNPDVLNQRLKVPPNYDKDTDQIIEALEIAKPGESYTINELIRKMIVYSDNNSFFLLLQSSNEAQLKQVYNDLHINFPAAGDTDPNFITARDYSYFLRVLYNATYLPRDLSEKALSLLGDATFKDALVGGVPSDVIISHKFGHRTGITQEFHDCGIIYKKDSPYLLCVMTKTKTKIENAQDLIKDISKEVYDTPLN